MTRPSSTRPGRFSSPTRCPYRGGLARAGVGISALYRRYPSKEDLLGTLCANGQPTYMAEAERALADDGDPWEAYATFLRRIVAADTHSLTVRLAGTFVPNAKHLANAADHAATGRRTLRPGQERGCDQARRERTRCRVSAGTSLPDPTG